jgi:type IV pilus assembly protein PilC
MAIDIAAHSRRMASSKTRSGPGQGNPPVTWVPRLFARVKQREVTLFASQLSLMLEIGAPLSKALDVLAAQGRNPVFQQVIRRMRRDIEEGHQLSEAMGRHPRVFAPLLVQMVRAGETGGFLKKILDQIVEMQEKRSALVAQLRSTLTYPAVLCFVASAVLVFVLVGILPRFMVLFEGNERLLPLTTRILVWLSTSIRAYGPVYLLGVAGLAVGLRLWMKSAPGRLITDRLMVSAPVVSRVANKIYTCQLLRILGNLLDSSIPLIQALEITRPVFVNRHFRHFVGRIRDHVQQGGRFSQPFAGFPHILPAVREMIVTGEEAGKLPTVMLRLADFYDIEVEQELKTLAAMLEPLALIVMGSVIGTIVAAVILPLFRIASVIH